MKILVIDDHALFRDGLSYVLQHIAATVEIAQASDYRQAMDYIAQHPDLDLVLLDLNLPGKSGFAVLETITLQYPALCVAIVSASDHPADVQRALDAGAMGYIPKNTTSAVMLSALRLIFAGGIYNPLRRSADKKQPLTPRQLEVLKLLVEGCSNKVIAHQLELSEATVKMHVTAIFKSLHVTNRTQAALKARENGWYFS